MPQPRVFVAGGYLMNGGAHMAYHVGRILHEYFGCQVSVFGPPRPKSSCFAYPYDFPSISPSDAERAITETDILVSTGGLSGNMYGPRLPGRKLCYVQGVNTYAVLDAFFDQYVFSAQFVREHAAHYFGVDGRVIHPFIDTDLFSGGKPWRERRNQIAVLGFKPITKALLPLVQRHLNQHFPNGTIPIAAFEYLTQEQLAGILGESRYYLSLSALEGFGLPMLEAMGSGCAVVGFDAFGGKEFLADGQNALVAHYPNTRRLAEHLAFAIANPDEAQRLAQDAYTTSRQFSRSHFDAKWKSLLTEFLENG